MTFRLTRFAQDDIAGILRKKRKFLGQTQLLAYAKTIDHGIAMIADEAARPASLDRGDITHGARSFHLQLATGRRHGASHFLYDTETNMPHGEKIVVVLRVLHEAMESKRKLGATLRAQITDDTQ